MTDARVLVGRTVTKIATRDDRTYLSFLDRSSMDVREIRLYLDGPFEVEPEPDGAGDGDLELTLFLRLGELPGLTVDGAEIGPEGDLRVEFSEGTRVTAFGPRVDEPPYTTWQLQER
jgi:hypothetical protein